MSPQTETKASAGFKAGVKDYKLTYYTLEYETKDTDPRNQESSNLDLISRRNRNLKWREIFRR